MNFTARIFAMPVRRRLTVGDFIILLTVAVVIYAGVRLAFAAPAVITGPQISLEPSALPRYASYSPTMTARRPSTWNRDPTRLTEH